MAHRKPKKAKKPAETARPKTTPAAVIVDDRLAPLIAVVVMLVAAVVYVRTAARDLVVGDSVEFATIALNGGVAHPPGYPLLMILGRLFSYLPFGTPVFRVNLVSVVAGVATAGLVVLIARRSRVSSWPFIQSSGNGRWRLKRLRSTVRSRQRSSTSWYDGTSSRRRQIFSLSRRCSVDWPPRTTIRSFSWFLRYFFCCGGIANSSSRSHG
jgi:hypothetical protein